MKTRAKKSTHISLKEDQAAYHAGNGVSKRMLRTQIYLTHDEHLFLQSEAARLGKPMASLIRGYVDEKMEIPDEAWAKHPFLRPVPDDPGWEGHEDGGINHDHYVYGCPKKYVKKKGKWVPAKG